MKQIEVTLSEQTLEKLEDLITIDRFEIDISTDTLISNVTGAYFNIISYGLQELDHVLTWKEFEYMLRCIIETDFISYNINYVANQFMEALAFYNCNEGEALEIDEVELISKLTEVQPIACFALVALLEECWGVIASNSCDPRAFVESHLILKDLT